MANEKQIPFVFGKRVEGVNFTDRVEETSRLKMNFLYGVNTILISPRRMGKTSLVDRVCSLIDDDHIKIVKIDAFGLRCEADFINAFATAVIKATSDKWDELMANAKTFLSRFSPKISFGQDPFSEFSISLELSPRSRIAEDVLSLPELIAEKRGVRIIICIDEFQQIGDFADSLSFQKKLRSVWQLQRNVSYCLYGSKKHLMEKMFQSKSYPFYRFGDMVYLGKIDEEQWTEYICSRFEVTGKHISKEFAAEICRTADRYSSYVQQLAWLVWLNTDNEVTADDMHYGIERLLDACEHIFILQTESLSEYQMNFLRALSDGITAGFTKQAVVRSYRLGTTANITRLKKSLSQKDLIVMTAPGTLEFSDPILKLWLKRRLWKNRPYNVDE